MVELNYDRVFKQRPYCCVPASLSIILDRRDIAHESQEDIRHELGLTVPDNMADRFTKVRIGKMPVAGYGTQVGKEQYFLNSYFSNNNIELQEYYFPVEDIANVREFIEENLKAENDIIACFNYAQLHGGPGDWEHVSLIQSIDGNTVTLIDPEVNVPVERIVKLEKLIVSMQVHGEEKRGGLWVIKKK